MTGEQAEKQLSVIMIAFLVYLSLPVAWSFLLYGAQEAGFCPVDADSISIPFAGFMVLWFAGLLSGILAGVLLACTHDANNDSE